MITNSLNKNLGDTVLANVETPRKVVKEFSPTAHLAGRLSKVKLNLLHKNGSSCKCLEKSLGIYFLTVFNNNKTRQVCFKSNRRPQ